MQEVLCEIVLSYFELVFRKTRALRYRDIKSIPLCLHEVQVEEINDFRTVLPRPGT